tara:strand:- start:22 stop:348 length:327 start_codon:yes stop_codon:yes gene_type:complete
VAVVEVEQLPLVQIHLLELVELVVLELQIIFKEVLLHTLVGVVEVLTNLVIQGDPQVLVVVEQEVMVEQVHLEALEQLEQLILVVVEVEVVKDQVILQDQVEQVVQVS